MDDQKVYFNLSLKERIYLNSNRKTYFGLNLPGPQPPNSQIPNSYDNLKLSQTSSISSQPLIKYSMPFKSHVDLDRFADRVVTENRTFFNTFESNKNQEIVINHDLKVFQLFSNK